MSAMEKKTGEKKNFFTPISNYLKDVRGELRKVVFPTFKQVRKNTVIVIIVVIIVGVIIAGLDFVFNNARNYLIQNEDNLINQVQQGGDITQPPLDVAPQGELEVPTDEGSNQE